MNLFQKIGALWKARKVVAQMGEIKRGWKSLAFWVTLLGNVLGVLASVKGILPATAVVIGGAALTSLYTILRGAQKTEESGVREWWKTTEFWLSVGTSLSGGLVSVQQGGVNPAWIASANTVLAGVLGIARDLAHKEPKA